MKLKILAACVALVACSALAWFGASERDPQATKITYTRFLEQVRAGEVTAVVISSRNGAAPVRAQLRDGRTASSVLPADYGQAMHLMQERNINIDIEAPGASLVNAIPFLLLVAVWLVLVVWMRRAPGLPRLW